MGLHKIHRNDDGEGTPHVHAHTWTLEETSGPDRLVVAPRDGFVDTMMALAKVMDPPLFALYVLQKPRTEALAGRYQSALLEYGQLDAFMLRFGAFLEQDGRHNLWLGRVGGTGTIIYDEHNFLYCYGPLDRFLDVLDERGFEQGQFSLPEPHGHPIHPSFDDDEREITALEGFWRRGELRPQDER